MDDFSDIMLDQTGSTSLTARKMARNALRKANRQENAGTITLVGDPRLVAGVTVNLKNFGAFDAKYIIARATHRIAGGYTVDIDVRKCLNGY